LRALILANHSGGLYDFRNGLLTSLIDRGDEVIVSVPDDSKTDLLRKEGCRVIHTDIDRRGVNPAHDLKLIGAYESLIRDEKPDVVLTYTIKPNIYGGYAASKAGVPYITTVTGLGSTFEKGGALLKIITGMYRKSLKNCSCLFFQNAENRGIFRKYGIIADKDRLVSGSGVDLEIHRAEPYPGHDGDKIRFLYAGRLMKEKGTDEYMSAAKRLHEKYGDRVRCETVGFCDDDYTSKLEEGEKEGWLKSHPYTTDIIPFLRKADAIVMPSYHEGMSNVVMEGSATARPELVSDISGCREIVEPGVTGLLYPPGNADALFEAMDEFVLMPLPERRAMGLAARVKMEREFDRSKVIKCYLEEIDNAAGSGKRT